MNLKLFGLNMILTFYLSYSLRISIDIEMDQRSISMTWLQYDSKAVHGFMRTERRVFSRHRIDKKKIIITLPISCISFPSPLLLQAVLLFFSFVYFQKIALKATTIRKILGVNNPIPKPMTFILKQKTEVASCNTFYPSFPSPLTNVSPCLRLMFFISRSISQEARGDFKRWRSSWVKILLTFPCQITWD